LDHICRSRHFMVAGVDQWQYDWWIHSYPAGHRHRRGADSSHSGTKTIVATWTLAGEGEVFGKEVFGKLGKIFSNLRIRWVEKVS
jgi:hypothetical protein